MTGCGRAAGCMDVFRTVLLVGGARRVPRGHRTGPVCFFPEKAIGVKVEFFQHGNLPKTGLKPTQE